MKPHLCRICYFVLWITWRKNRGKHEFKELFGLRLGLDINISTKYVYAKKHTQQEWKTHGNHVLRMEWKLGCASVAWNMSLYDRDKDFSCASVEPWNQVVQMSWKPSCASVVYNHIVDKDFRLSRCRILKSNFTDVVKVSLCQCSV